MGGKDSRARTRPAALAALVARVGDDRHRWRAVTVTQQGQRAGNPFRERSDTGAMLLGHSSYRWVSQLAWLTRERCPDYLSRSGCATRSSGAAWRYANCFRLSRWGLAKRIADGIRASAAICCKLPVEIRGLLRPNRRNAAHASARCKKSQSRCHANHLDDPWLAGSPRAVPHQISLRNTHAA